MKLIEHGKYYSDTMNVRCEECRCLYEITKEDINVYDKPKKVRVGCIDCSWKEKRNYYTLCPECRNDNSLTDNEYYAINKKVKGD